MPLRPEGNSDACHPNSRSTVSGLIVVPRRVEHHLDNAFDLAVRRFDAADIDAETTRDRGTHLARVQCLALDVAALDDVFSEGLEDRLLLKRKPQGFHAAKQPALPMTDRNQRVRHPLRIPAELGPASQFVNVLLVAPHYLR